MNVTAVAPVNAVPVIVTVAPTRPAPGENDVIVGGDAVTLKLEGALLADPHGVITPTGPVEAPAGTAAMI